MGLQPKVSKVGKFRKTAAAVETTKQQQQQQLSSSSTIATVATIATKETSNIFLDTNSRGQRKRQAKRDQYLKRQNLVLSTLQLKREDDQKNRIDGLDALKAAVVTISSQSAIAQTQTAQSHALDHQKSKRQLTIREVNHMELVLEHPAFQANPFETIQEHLKNTLKNQQIILEQEGNARQKANDKAREQKKLLKKEKLQGGGGKHRKKFRATKQSKR